MLWERATSHTTGVFVPMDPKSPDALMKKGQIAFDFGAFFEKGLKMG